MSASTSAPTSAELVDAFGNAVRESMAAHYLVGHPNIVGRLDARRARDAAHQALLARLAAYDALAAAARVVVAGYDRIGCKELRDALVQLDGGAE